MPGDVNNVINAVADIASEWRAARSERQSRRHLDSADFTALREAGLLTLIVPATSGGTWIDYVSSSRGLCDAYRRLAGGDASVALVSSMHPSVINYWLANPDPSQPDWERQRGAV